MHLSESKFRTTSFYKVVEKRQFQYELDDLTESVLFSQGRIT